MPKIFISFRRSDTAASATLLHDGLRSRFGAQSVFIDSATIAQGQSYAEAIRDAIESIDYMVVLIGPKWAGAGRGTISILELTDPVRNEIQFALQAHKVLIPILVEGATMPSAEQLPESIRALASANCFELDMGRRRDESLKRIIQFIDSYEGMKGLGRTPPLDPTSVKPSPRIILSYRRADSGGVAGRLFDRICERFGADDVYMDIDSIPFGTNFRKHVETALSGCKVMVALIGASWTGKRFFLFQPRIFDQNDPIRIEVDTALRMSVPILPVLLDGAKIDAMRLPKGLKDLYDINGAILSSGQDFGYHTERLLRSLDGFVNR